MLQKLSREQDSAAGAAAAPAAAYEPVQKHKVTSDIPGWLNKESIATFEKHHTKGYFCLLLDVSMLGYVMALRIDPISVVSTYMW